MLKLKHYEFAIFPTRKRARRCKRVLDAATEAEAEIVASPADIARQNLPIELTLARRGALIGALTMATIAVVLGVALTSAGLAPTLGANIIGLLAIVALAAGFGALAGGLAFATETAPALAKLQTQLARVKRFGAKFRPTALLVRGRQDHTRLLQRHGAVQVAQLS